MPTATPYNNQRGIIFSANDTGFTPSTLVLRGFPDLEDYHFGFAVPLLMIYIVTLLGNCTLLMVIQLALKLHTPMYIFISQLAITDLIMSSCVLPKLLAIFWFHDTEIRFSSCLIQMFFSVCCLALETSILSAMAFDRYVAVCNPLRYSSILTNALIVKIATASLARSIVLVAPIPLLILRLPFCSRQVAHWYCENMAVAKLSCTDITLNNVYTLIISFLVAPVDIVCIALSYILILKTIVHLPLKHDRFKAFNTCSSHISVMSAFYIPLFSANLLNRMQHTIPQYVQVIVSATGLLVPPVMNPLIYGVTLEVRLGVHQVFQKVLSKLSKMS
ncbi:olfactory receptor 52K1-like [Pleurodeles waltl]|uniref:olfactory receptor 52K1-like n=1 Tax=Pleurodeles waltl TaxID=8319 RepID=UPI0037094D22